MRAKRDGAALLEVEVQGLPVHGVEVWALPGGFLLLVQPRMDALGGAQCRHERFSEWQFAQRRKKRIQKATGDVTPACSPARRRHRHRPAPPGRQPAAPRPLRQHLQSSPSSTGPPHRHYHGMQPFSARRPGMRVVVCKMSVLREFCSSDSHFKHVTSSTTHLSLL